MQQFARIRANGTVIPVLLEDDEHLDLRPIVPDITPEAIGSGVLAKVDASRLAPVRGDFTYVAPIEGIRQVTATGFNYKKHIEELNVAPPSEPELFMKASTSLTGPYDAISRGPNEGVKLDWEVELAVVVARVTQDITAATAADHIFGYVCLNDVSDRSTQVDAQKRQHLTRAKSRPGYCPIGPYLTTGIDGMNLDLWTKLNGEYEQRSNTGDMLFSIDELIAYFSRHLTLLPGDLIATGTPPGTGFGKGRFMAVGDVLECGGTGLGSQKHDIRA